VVDLLGDAEPISSTRIREALAAGRVDAAARDLGRWYEVRGVVVSGDARGAGMGFPTANLRLSETVAVPGRGVYAVLICHAGSRHDGVANIGVRPTFGGSAEVVEVHLFDFDGSLYGEQLAVQFVAKLRGEQRFDGVDALVRQIRFDVATARRVLAEAGTDGPHRERPIT